MITYIIIFMPFVFALLLFYFLIGIFKETEPKIITLNDSIRMIGISTRTGMDTIFKDAVRLGKEYKKIKDQNLIHIKRNHGHLLQSARIFRELKVGNTLWGML
jgi:hypothetical protein